MILLNSRAVFQPYDEALRCFLSLAEGRHARDRLRGWSLLSPAETPLWSLSGLALSLGLASVSVKDESKRSRLGSFKALGAPNALLKLALRRWPRESWSTEELLAGRHSDALKGFVVISATDGNHGRALAAAARSVGCRCVIVLHAHVSLEREQAISALGAEIIRVMGNYDESVVEAARLAGQNGWEVVSDTSYEGYEDVPRDVMQGYGVIALELLRGLEDTGACPWTHVILQGGVGGLAAGIVGPFCERFQADRPRFVVVEPEQADCLLRSAEKGRPAVSTGTIDSVMAGLACGQTSPLAWRFLQPAVDVFMTVPDRAAVSAMRELALGAKGDIPIVSGESGAAGLAGLLELLANQGHRESAGLGSASRVLLINTEGATAPSDYANLVGRTGEQVAASQRTWLRLQANAESSAAQWFDPTAQ